MSAPGANGCSPFRRSEPTTSADASGVPPPRDEVIVACQDRRTDLAALLTRRAGRDPAWWLVVRQYALGHARWPDPFQPRKPTPPA